MNKKIEDIIKRSSSVLAEATEDLATIKKGNSHKHSCVSCGKKPTWQEDKERWVCAKCIDTEKMLKYAKKK